jgi:Domain of unknown function (DUF4326)
MPHPLVVNLRTTHRWDIYIGRASPRRRLKASIWANPFRIGPDGTRAAVIAQYEAWLLTQPHLLAQLPSLYGKVLSCWCAPKPCHGEVLAKLAELAMAQARSTHQ